MRKVLVVDDQPLMAGLIKSVLEQKDYVCEVANDASEARAILDDFELDLAIIDLNLGDGPSGYDIAHLVAKKFPRSAILAMTGFASPEFIGQVGSELPESASLVSKAQVSDADQLFEAVESAISSGSVFRATNTDMPLGSLTQTQIQVLRLMAEGYQTAEIASRRETTASAVEQAITGIYRNLGIDESSAINRRTEAIRLYIANAGLPFRDQVG